MHDQGLSQTYVIAEAGVNHNGSQNRALELIDAAAAAAADAVKFQTFRADDIVTKKAEKAVYQRALTDPTESQWSMLKSLELGAEVYLKLKDRCAEVGVDFISTPFDVQSLSFLTKGLGVKKLKISSGDITNGPLLLEAAKSGCDVILSTGMSTLGEVEQALQVLAYGYLAPEQNPSTFTALEASYSSEEGQRLLRKHVTVLHCTSEYPSPLNEVNLTMMDTMRAAFQLPVGLADQTVGINIPIAAVARGAAVIEKHFTLNKQLPGPDHKASLDPHELRLMVEGIRQVERALGQPVKYPTMSEAKNRVHVRKSLVARTKVREGDQFSEENLTAKRPGEGITPMQYWDFIGKSASRTYYPDESISES